jgi:NAD(P)-dependent dehydrogenase (short-subunit alcohol dehydrogenase family)
MLARDPGMNFDGKVVLVTGAGRGTGRQAALSFAVRGAYVAANDITPINLDQTLDQIDKAGGIGVDIVTDISKKMPVQSMVAEVLDRWGRIDFLVNNAGVEPLAPVLDMDAWDWQRTLDVNLNGAFFLTQVVGRVMREQGGGAMIHVAALPAVSDQFLDRSAYVSSKMGLIGLTQVAARELAPFNIRVNAVHSGMLHDGMLQLVGKNQTLTELKPVQQKLHAQPQDLLSAIMFLCTDEASHINGQIIHVEKTKHST